MRQRAFLLFALILVLSGVARAGEPVTVLTSLEVTAALGRVLTENTSVQVVNAVPRGYGMAGHDAYFKKHHEAFFALAEQAEAVLTVTAAWSADPLYEWARRGNIRIVEIDAAKPLDGYGAGVPLTDVEGEYSPYVWRSPANLTRMAAIAGADLCRLVPGDAETIRANLKTLQGRLFRLRARFEGELLAVDAGLAAMTGDYVYLTDEFGLDVRFTMLKPELSLTGDDLTAFTARIREENVRAVICAWEPDERLAQAVREGGAVAVTLERFKPVEGETPLDTLAAWYEGNLSRLAAALNQ